jgi:hypothetical protein
VSPEPTAYRTSWREVAPAAQYPRKYGGAVGVTYRGKQSTTAALLGTAHGLRGILGILFGIGTGQQFADGLANRNWGHVPTTN